MSTVAWLTLAALIVFTLAAYAFFLLFKLRALRLKQQVIAEEKLKQQSVRDLKVLDSIILIAKAMAEKQCEVSEGCWRLSVLMDSLEQYKIRFNSEFTAIFNLYNKIKHMPILEARKALSKKDKLKLDLERMAVETELEADVATSVEQLIPYAIDLKESLFTE